ncbi:ragulator complex protein LAMTOR5 [Aplysia californica]|uniref:Late endosomal/lysosomal adaptor and MAPK and MTOR activator 5 n=1 Tax=Aplysia californica TaxID=6500 RepID=A0ABM0K1P5_APLCA|nr:ragulator complex protein LAMTOR5 [Aplysia californica]
MEKSLEKQMEEAFRIPGISGVMCVDKNGLLLGGKGNVPRHASGSLSALTNQASRLSPGNPSSSPVICLESEAGSVLVKKTDNLTTAMFKTS